MPATLIDPHGDLAELVLTQLIQRGEFAHLAAYDRLVYLDLPAAARAGRFLPFNYLRQPYDDSAMAELVAEACRRAWPELAQGAPTFENILKHSVIALRQNHQPLTKLANLLVDKDFRDQLLRNVTDEQVQRFFHQRMDQTAGCLRGRRVGPAHGLSHVHRKVGGHETTRSGLGTTKDGL